MRQLILLILTMFLVNSNNAQKTRNNHAIPEILYGEWYNIDDGQLKLAVYNNMIIYQKSQYFLDTIETIRRNQYLLKLNGFEHREIQIKLKGQKAIVSDKRLETAVMTKNKNLCKIKHELPAIKGPVFENNSIWFDCYFEDPAVYPSKQRVTIRTYDYIRNTTNYTYQFISKENSVAFKLPVSGPTLINVSFSTGRKQQFFMMPGKQLIELVTKTRGYKYMSDAAPLNAELKLIEENTDILPGPNNLIYPLILQQDSIRAIEPESYKSIAHTKEAKSKSILDSLYRTKMISPLTYQIEKLNIIYTYANLLLNYNNNMAIALKHYKLPHEKESLNLSYFDFLKDVDNELGPIAPEYANFISNLLNENNSTDLFTFPDIADFKNNLNSNLNSIDALIDIIIPVENKNEMFSIDEQNLFDTIISLEHNPKSKAQFLEKNRAAVQSVLDYYSYLNGITSIISKLEKATKRYFDWQPGTLTDLFIVGNIIRQTINGDAAVPSYFFNQESGYFTNQYIAKYLSKENQEKQKPIINSKESQLAKWSTIDKDKVKTKETIKRSGLELTFVNYDENFPDSTKAKMIETFFKVYPIQLKQYNNTAPKHITFIIDPQYNGVAATADSLTRFNPVWLKLHPYDIDVVTHEVMHIVQCYQNNNYEPRWVAEGIADYVRLKMGLYNEKSKWTLPEFNQNQHPEDSYRVTAKFFNWLEQHKKKNIVKDLDIVMRENNYSESFWSRETNENLDQLWKDYAKASIN